MEAGFQEDGGALKSKNSSKLLELAATDDLAGFVYEVKEMGCDLDEPSFWYCRSFGAKKMGFEERTPLMIASLYGSTEVLKYILSTAKVDVNKACGSDVATPLHCAAAGGSWSSVEVVKLLIDSSGDIGVVDAEGKKPGNLVAPCVKFASSADRRTLEMLLNGMSTEVEEGKQTTPVTASKDGIEKKEYPVDASLPDINNGVYGSDEFRMYSFKVKLCSRAYSHDWTECPFVHPGENARRRDPRKYQYTCVPCPEFKKGNCGKEDACEYAHGVFESWLHPVQYKTRLCKDETGCSRKVCFFAHKPEELRPLYASTGSAMPSPKSVSGINSLNLTASSHLYLGTSSLVNPNTSTPPISPSVTCSSPTSGSMWQNKVNLTPPTLQLAGSHRKPSLSARDVELLRQHLIEEMAGLSPPYGSRIRDVKPTNLDDVFGSFDPSVLSHLQVLSPNTMSSQLQSPTGLQIRQNMNHPSNFSSSPSRKPSPGYGFDSSAAVAAAVMNSRSHAFTHRSHSLIERNGIANRSSLSGSATSPGLMPSKLADWSSPSGKLEWGFSGDEVNKLRKSASFGIRSGHNSATSAAPTRTSVDEPVVSWVNSMVKDVPPAGGAGLYRVEQKPGGGIHETMPHWVDQMYIEPEQMMA